MNHQSSLITTVNSVVFIERNYVTVADMYSRISEQIHLLMEMGYICVVRAIAQPERMIIIDFNPASPTEQDEYPQWIYADELEVVRRHRREVEIEMYKNEIARLEAEVESEENAEDDTTSNETPEPKWRGDA